MRLCRFDDDRLGWVADGVVRDVTAVLARLPAVRWPLPSADPLWRDLAGLRAPLEEAARRAPPVPLGEVRLRSPVARPGKILAIRRNRGNGTSARPDVFLKATSAVAGPAEGIRLPSLGRACDCELEVALIIGRSTATLPPGNPLATVAGCCLALDLAVAGDEDRGLRKSADTFCVLGPWVSELADLPDLRSMALALSVDGALRQSGRLADQPFAAAQIVAYLASFMTLHPGDVVLAGCPAPPIGIAANSVLRACGTGLGEMEVRVHAAGGLGDSGLR
jgi:2-keto-4-pentenoate hydratase/2-oxohepta-3-ene-1,7-dioic acid hydratase in catechol pathway